MCIRDRFLGMFFSKIHGVYFAQTDISLSIDKTAALQTVSLKWIVFYFGDHVQQHGELHVALERNSSSSDPALLASKWRSESALPCNVNIVFQSADRLWATVYPQHMEFTQYITLPSIQLSSRFIRCSHRYHVSSK